VATRLRVVQGFFSFLHDQGYIFQSPIRHPRHHILVPQDLPRPMAEDEVSALFRVIDALRDRTMFLLMLRCGLRVGEVSSLPWSAIDLGQGTVRINNSKGHVDRVVYLAPDVAKALQQWQRHQAAATQYVFPNRGASLTAQRGPVEKTQPMHDGVAGAVGETPFLMEHVEIALHVARRQGVRTPFVISGEVADRPEIGPLGGGDQPSYGHILDHALL
jgi:integrase